LTEKKKGSLFGGIIDMREVKPKRRGRISRGIGRGEREGGGGGGGVV